jgi:hypothetical protein
MGCHLSPHVAGRLGRSQVAAVSKRRDDVALQRVVQLGIGPRERPKVPGPPRVVLHVAEYVDDVALRQPLEDRFLQPLGGLREVLSWNPLQDRLASRADDHLAVIWVVAVDLLGRCREPGPQLIDETARSWFKAELTAVVGDHRFTLAPGLTPLTSIYSRGIRYSPWTSRMQSEQCNDTFYFFVTYK